MGSIIHRCNIASARARCPHSIQRGWRARSAADKTCARHLLERRTAAAGQSVRNHHGRQRDAGGEFGQASAYTYFATREALFLALVARELSQWMAALERAFRWHCHCGHAGARHGRNVGEARTLRLCWPPALDARVQPAQTFVVQALPGRISHQLNPH